ncbi:hypothetical protein VRRI112168_14160 [Vreelandella rituensis]|uniref:C2H2-type domain-containing protein n=1 Tax=Vreelandella rituensis TaxID=2282306 RepID=A0A368TV67_9GAMM|nr:hypothetical protein [Halomonas rituensis]RCV88538.1 hypothetical protein DU506_14495 [Halomonas rituensis]
MFKRSREVACPECKGANFWKGDPRPDDALNCRYCKAFIATRGDHVHHTFRHEAVRILSDFIEAKSEQDIAVLKAAL